jgi:hypothetical protein
LSSEGCTPCGGSSSWRKQAKKREEPVHLFDREALDADHLVVADDAGREVVLVVPSPVSDTGVETSDLLSGLGTVLAALLLFGKPTLSLRQFLLILDKIPGIANGLAG